MLPKNLASDGSKMYRNPSNDQLDIYDFILPFGGHLNEDNRWVKPHTMINWELIREVYGSNIENKDARREAFPGDVAFGALYIQRKLGFTDRELVDQIAENRTCSISSDIRNTETRNLLTRVFWLRFRKRLPESAMSEIPERMFISCDDIDNKDSNSSGGAGSKEACAGGGNDGSDKEKSQRRRTINYSRRCSK